MSGKRRAGGPVRQLSLQQTQSARRHPRGKEDNPPRLRRQVSEDHGLRVLASHIVTPGDCDYRPRRDPQPVVVRPRPVRVAWAERRQVTFDSDPPVGVVVQRCKGLPRPVTAKPVRTAAAPDTILYSRQELAERLRLAWKDRQERPNLDIFLAHNSIERSDPEEVVLSVREIQTEVEKNKFITSEHSVESSKFTPFSDVINISPNVINNSSDIHVNGSFRRRDEPPDIPRFEVSSIQTFPTKTFPLAAFRESSDSEKDNHVAPLPETPKIENTKPKLTPSITISFDQGTDSDDQCALNDNDEDVPSSTNVDESSDHLLKPDSYSHIETPKEEYNEEDSEEKKNEKLKEPDKPKKESLTANMRRANFRNMNNNPVMSGTVSASPTPPSTPVTNPAKPILKKPPGQPLQRMMSAPATGRPPPPKKDPVISRLEARNDSVDLDFDEDDLAIVQRETRVKSAPARRRFKSGRRRGPKSHEDDSSEDELGCLEETPTTTKPRHRKRFVERAADIVTMVSLLSPNESEVEDPPEPVIQLPPDTSSWSTARTVTQESKTEMKEVEAKSVPTPVTPASIVCLRKFPVKTVSFQQSSPVNRSYTASYPSRRGLGSPLILPPPEPSSPPPPPQPPPLPLARRRLTKAKSAGILGQENSVDAESLAEVEEVTTVVDTEVSAPEPSLPPPANALRPQTPTVMAPAFQDPTDSSVDSSTEPSFKTPKERECWQMFRKMAEKGVSVSYETVLRGMLTPTEYRLYKKSMSSTC